MRIGYNTNGFAHHKFSDALEVLRAIGFESVAITLDHHVLNPFDADVAQRVRDTRRWLERAGMRCVVETGARFLLDRFTKHHPTLLSDAASDRARRMDFLLRAIDIAADLNADAVSYWSGVVPNGLAPERAMCRLLEGMPILLDQAIRRGVRLAFEPEPGMLIERTEQFAELVRAVDHPLFGLTIDVGHVHCVDDESIPEVLWRWSDRLFNVHIEDMRRGVHDHLMFGEGEIDFSVVFRALHEIRYEGGVHVELSRHSHDAVNAARKSYEFLGPLR